MTKSINKKITLFILLAALLVSFGSNKVLAEETRSNKQLIIFENSKTNNVITSQQEVGQLIGAPLADKVDGYLFIGWAKGYNDGKPVFWDFEKDVMQDSGLMLFAEYGKSWEFFYENEVLDVPSVAEYLEGSKVVPPVAPNVEGKKFIGWAHAYGAQGEPVLWDFENYVVPNHNVMLFATYADLYYVDFVNGYANEDIMIEFEANKHVEYAPTPIEIEGMKFIGWSKGFDGSKSVLWDFDNDLMPEHNIQLHAVYKYVVTASSVANGEAKVSDTNEITLSFDKDINITKENISLTLEDGSTLEVTSLTKNDDNSYTVEISGDFDQDDKLIITINSEDYIVNETSVILNKQLKEEEVNKPEVEKPVENTDKDDKPATTTPKTSIINTPYMYVAILLSGLLALTVNLKRKRSVNNIR